MKKNQISDLISQSAANSIAAVIIDVKGNVIVRYFDEAYVEKSANCASLAMGAIGDIVNEISNKSKSDSALSATPDMKN